MTTPSRQPLGMLHNGVPADVLTRPASGASPDPGLAGPADPVAILAAVDLARHSLQADRALGDGFVASRHFPRSRAGGKGTCPVPLRARHFNLVSVSPWPQNPSKSTEPNWIHRR